jgi:uncharacterized membrane protein
VHRCGPHDKTNLQGCLLETDDVPDILNRIEWSAMRENRVNYVVRYLIWGLFVTFLGTPLIAGEFPTTGLFFRNWIIISIVLLSIHGYYYWHSDKFSQYNILRAVEILRERLKLEKGVINNASCDKKFTGADASWTFTHTDYALGTRFP